MKIEEIRIGMKLRNPHADMSGKVIRIEKEGGLKLQHGNATWNEHVENVELVGEFHVGDRVRQIGPSVWGFTDNMGEIGTVKSICQTGIFECKWDNGTLNNMSSTNIALVGELRIGDYVRATGKSTTFEEDVNGKIGIIDSFMHDAGGDLCADIRWLCGSSNLVKVAQLTPLAHGEAMAHVINSQCKPLGEVAKCYVQVEPEKLLLPQDARRVIEYLTATDTPVDLWRIVDEMGDMMTDTSILDGLIEAREAGRIRLDGGKYSIARD